MRIFCCVHFNIDVIDWRKCWSAINWRVDMLIILIIEPMKRWNSFGEIRILVDFIGCQSSAIWKRKWPIRKCFARRIVKYVNSKIKRERKKRRPQASDSLHRSRCKCKMHKYAFIVKSHKSSDFMCSVEKEHALFVATEVELKKKLSTFIDLYAKKIP